MVSQSGLFFPKPDDIGRHSGARPTSSAQCSDFAATVIPAGADSSRPSGNSAKNFKQVPIEDVLGNRPADGFGICLQER